jgi:RNA polymerase sigma factor (sigma-70 family)
VAARHRSEQLVTGPAPRGDEAELFERDSERLLRVVRRAIGGRGQIAEDACSFAWLQLLRTQPERNSIFPWLCTVAINEARRLLKGQTRLAEFDENPAEPTATHVDTGADVELALEARQALELMAELSDQKVRIFSLHVAGFTYDEICAATGYSWTQVNRHMVRARSRVRARREASRRASAGEEAR